MRSFQLAVFSTGILWLSALAADVRAEDTTAAIAPPFSEIYSAVRSNLVGVTDSELNRAAVTGFLAQLPTQVSLGTNASAAAFSAVPLLSKTNVLEGAYAFLRIGRVAPGLAKQTLSAFEQLRATSKLRGLIVDLRFAVGQDYPAAAETADLFFKTEQPLLRWGGMTASSTPKSTAIDLPVVVLINRYTSGAAEALAAALRQADSAVLIGSPSAGNAYVFKDVPLSGGQVLRIASGAVAAGNGQPLPQAGLVPDIRVTLNLEDEKAYFEDPYRTALRPFAQSGKPSPAELASAQNTNRPKRRLNEAELVRMQRDGLDLEAEPLAASPSLQTGPTITDPALSRGLDLLKGLALALKRR